MKYENFAYKANHPKEIITISDISADNTIIKIKTFSIVIDTVTQ